MPKLVRYYFRKLGANFVDFSLDYPNNNLSLIGSDVVYVGSSGVDRVYVAKGVKFTFNNSGTGSDEIYLGGSFADYTLTAVGTSTLLLSSTAKANTSITLAGEDKVFFSDGSSGVKSLIDYAAARIATPSTPLPTLNTAENSLTLPSTSNLDSILRAYTKDPAGVVFAQPHAGVEFILTGHNGVDKVYVSKGGKVNANNLGTGVDLIYLTGNKSDYSATASGTSVLILTKGTERVTLASEDRVIFADGSTLVSAAIAAASPANWPNLSLDSTRTPLPGLRVEKIVLRDGDAGEAARYGKSGTTGLTASITFSEPVHVSGAVFVSFGGPAYAIANTFSGTIDSDASGVFSATKTVIFSGTTVPLGNFAVYLRNMVAAGAGSVFTIQAKTVANGGSGQTFDVSSITAGTIATGYTVDNTGPGAIRDGGHFFGVDANNVAIDPSKRDTLGIGDKVVVEVPLTEAVTITGTPEYIFKIGTANKVLNYDANFPGTTPSKIFLTYTILSGDVTNDGITALGGLVGALYSQSATTDLAGNETTILGYTQVAVANIPTLKVDGTAPSAPDLNGAANGNDFSTRLPAASARVAFSNATAILSSVTTASTDTDVARISLDFADKGNVPKPGDRLKVGVNGAGADVALALDSATDLSGTGLTIATLTGMDYSYSASTHKLTLFKHNGSAFLPAEIDTTLKALQFVNTTAAPYGKRSYEVRLLDRALNASSASTGGFELDTGTAPTLEVYSKPGLKLASSKKQYAALPSAAVAVSGDLTLEAWVFAKGTQGNWARIFDFASGTGSQHDNIILGFQDSTGKLAFTAFNGTSTTPLVTVTASSALTLNTWHHVAVTLGGTGALTATLYVDSVLVGTGTLSAAIASATRSSSFVGHSNFGDPDFNGAIRDVRIYDNTLSLADITSDISGNAPAATNVLSGYYPFATDAASAKSGGAAATLSGSPAFADVLNLSFSADTGAAGDFVTYTAAQTITAGLATLRVAGETLWASLNDGSTWTDVTSYIPSATNWVLNWTGATLLPGTHKLMMVVKDAAGNQGPMTVQEYTLDTTPPTASIDANKGLKLVSASSQYAGLPTAAVAVSSDLTLEAWVFADGTPGQSARVLDLASGANASNNLVLGFDSGKLFFQAYNGITSLGFMRSLSNFATNAWHHVAVTVGSGVSPVATLYVDGVVVQTDILGGIPPLIGRSSSFIGHSNFTGDPNFNGTIRDVRIYDSARSAAELASDMAGNVNIADTSLKGYYPLGSSNTTASGLTGGSAVTLSGSPILSNPTLTFSADTGVAGDYSTNTAAQTIKAQLNGTLGEGERVFGSLDNGSTWVDLSSFTSGNTITWTGVDLGTAGTRTLKLEVLDLAGNAGTVLSQSYTVL